MKETTKRTIRRYAIYTAGCTAGVLTGMTIKHALDRVLPDSDGIGKAFLGVSTGVLTCGIVTDAIDKMTSDPTEAFELLSEKVIKALTESADEREYLEYPVTDEPEVRMTAKEMAERAAEEAKRSQATIEETISAMFDGEAPTLVEEKENDGEEGDAR